MAREDDQAFEMGKLAWLAGKSSAPCQDPTLMEHLKECESTLETLNSWVSGWHYANAAATVPGL